MNTPCLIKSLMGLNNFSAQDLAKVSDITPATMSRYLSGKTDIKSESLIKILNSLNVDLRDILQKSLVRHFAINSWPETVSKDFETVWESLDELDQKTLLNSAVASVPSLSSERVLTASKALAQYANKLALRRRYA